MKFYAIFIILKKQHRTSPEMTDFFENLKFDRNWSKGPNTQKCQNLLPPNLNVGALK